MLEGVLVMNRIEISLHGFRVEIVRKMSGALVTVTKDSAASLLSRLIQFGTGGSHDASTDIMVWIYGAGTPPLEEIEFLCAAIELVADPRYPRGV